MSKNQSFDEDVKLAIGGDCDAFARLYSIVYKDLYHIAICSLRNQQDAADVVSETVLDAFASIKKLRSESAFKGWIVKILTNKVKQKQAEYMNLQSADNYNVVENIKGDEFNFGKHELAEEISRLNNEERLILSLSALMGYTSNEIARFCKINPATVRTKLARTKAKLREALG